ncbi:hypothetical protein JT55_05165 [Rhodovulum sp. NI22]|nr:hypothetical protein JT55_05165 [Rhodovulum sp. NI22]
MFIGFLVIGAIFATAAAAGTLISGGSLLMALWSYAVGGVYGTLLAMAVFLVFMLMRRMNILSAPRSAEMATE